jgi:hypothetical protein
MNAPTTEVWFQHALCGVVFQDPAGNGHCPGCGSTEKGKESVLRREFLSGSSDLIQFLMDASRVYTGNRGAEISRLLAEVARVRQKTTSP